LPAKCIWALKHIPAYSKAHTLPSMYSIFSRKWCRAQGSAHNNAREYNIILHSGFNPQKEISLPFLGGKRGRKKRLLVATSN